MAALPFPAHLEHRVAKNDEGFPAVLIRTRLDSSVRSALPLRLNTLRVVYSAPYRITHPSGEISDEIFTAIICTTAEPSFIYYFYRVMAGLLESVGREPSSTEVAALVDTLIQLFHSLVLAPANTVQGLWAELFVLASSTERAVALRTWHTTPGDRYDFFSGVDRCDVKSSATRERRHHFSLHQLDVPAGSKLYIASLFVERAAGGATLAALLEQVTSGIPGEEQLRVRLVCAETLGAAFEESLDSAFDYQLAAASLRFYEAICVPTVPAPLPKEISEVHFVVDLSAVPQALPASIDSSSLMRALSPLPSASRVA